MTNKGEKGYTDENNKEERRIKEEMGRRMKKD